MQAKERSFVFMKADSYYDIPFFQRAYVWKEENWAELLNNFFDHTDSHFLGSIILKQEQVSSGDALRFMVIDGQQRLTTLSILLRACYDQLKEDSEKYEDSVVNEFDTNMKSLLFIRPDSFSSKEDVKINHSKLDKPFFQRVINGELKDASDSDINKYQNKIERCYLYFREDLKNRSDKEIQALWDLLTKDKSKFLVNIDLGINENEQKIFDTVNSYGVRLSSSDTIKNSLFQFYIDALRKSGETEEEIDAKASELYDNTWGKAFTADIDTDRYWSATKRYGRLSRDNIEVLLHAFAVIKGFFDPSIDNIVTLSQKYKDCIKTMSKTEIESFLIQLSEYAEVFRKYFGLFDNETLLSFDDYKTRLLHLCYALDVATFYPYILKLLYRNENEGESSDEEIKTLLFALEKYIVLNAICGGSTKNYNNECVQLVRDRKTPDELRKSSLDITRRSFDEGLRNMRNNKIPTAILFWVELHNRSNMFSDINQLKYNYTLEHIMPQKWAEHWSIEKLPVYNENGYVIKDERDAAEERTSSVYEIGNMTLLNSRLNTALSNNTFEKKINGDGKKYKNCVRQLADLYLTKEIIDDQSWDERNIRKRTADLEKRIEKIWVIEFEDDKPIHLEIDDSNPKASYDALFEDGTEFKDILYSIERSDLNDEDKRIYKRIIADEIIDCFEGGYSWENEKRILEKDSRETLEKIKDDTYPYLISALLAADDGDMQKCIDCYKTMFAAGEVTDSNKVTEKDFLRYVFMPICDLLPSFYEHFYNAIEGLDIDPMVSTLCGVLDEFYGEEEFDDKIGALTSVCENDTENTNLNAIIGNEFYDEREWDSAIEYLEKCVGEDDLVVLSEEELLEKLSYALQKDSPRQSFKESIEICEKLLDIEKSGVIYARLGHAQYMLNQLSKSIETFKKCLEIEPTNTSAANDLAKALAFSKRKEELKSYIENPPIVLRKYTLEIAEKALSQTDYSFDKDWADTTEITGTRTSRRRRYWAYALPIIKESHGPGRSFGNVTTSKEYWLNGAIGVSGFYITCEAKMSNAGVCLSLTKADKNQNKSAFDYLASHKDEIENQLGVELKWWRLDDKKASYVSLYGEDMSISDESSWEQMASFHAEWSRKYYDVFAPLLKAWNSMQ